MKKIAATLAGAAMATMFASAAYAIPTLYLQSGISSVTVADGDLLDANGAIGAVTYIGAVGNFSINVSTGALGINTIDLNSIDTTSSSAGTLLLKFSDYGFNLANTGYSATIGGTTQGVVNYSAYYDLTNTLFGQGTQFFTGTKGNNTNVAFADAGMTSAPITSGPYSLTEVVSIAQNGGKTTSFDFNISPVPEPGTMMLMGAGFLGLAIYGKRRKNA